MSATPSSWTAHTDSRNPLGFYPGITQAARQIAEALRAGDFERAAALIQGSKAASVAAAILTEDESGMNLLHIACQAADAVSTRLLLERGADPSAASGPLEKRLLGSKRHGPTPLMLAAAANSPKCVEELAKFFKSQDQRALEKAFNAKDAQGRNAVLIAAEQGNVSALSMMHQLCPAAGVAVNARGENAAMLASRGGHIDCLRSIDRAACDPSSIWTDWSMDKQCAMSLAIASGNVECVEFLSQKALRWMNSDDPERVAKGRAIVGTHVNRLPLAARTGDDAMFEAMMEAALYAKKDPAAQEELLLECLQAAPQDAARLRRRLETMIDIAHDAAQARRPLSERGPRQLFEKLMEAVKLVGPMTLGAQDQSDEDAVVLNLRLLAVREPKNFLPALCAADPQGRSVLRQAVEKGSARIVGVLLELLSSSKGGSGPHHWPDGLTAEEFKAVVNRRDLLGRSSLAIAARNGDALCAEELLKAHADPARLDRHGYTPFYRAVESGNLDLARRLEFDGAKAARGFSGQSAAFLAAGWLPSKAIEWLMEGADPQELFAPARDGETVLHAAAAGHCVKRLRLLLPGSNPNARTIKGATPLLAALHVGFVEGVEMLLPFTDPTLSDKDGRTPLQNAITRPDNDPNDAMAKLLAQWIDPRHKPELSARWAKIFGARAVAVDAPSLASDWGRKALASDLRASCALWDRGAAPGQAPRQCPPAFGQPWLPRPAAEPGQDPAPEPNPDLPQCTKLARAAAAARLAMAKPKAPTRVARAP